MTTGNPTPKSVDPREGAIRCPVHNSIFCCSDFYKFHTMPYDPFDDRTLAKENGEGDPFTERVTLQAEYDSLPGSRNVSVVVPLVFIAVTIIFGVVFSFVLLPS